LLTIWQLLLSSRYGNEDIFIREIINSKMLFQSVHVLVFNIIIISGYGERNQETS